MNGNDLYDWKRNPVTQAVFAELEYRIKEMIDYLINNEGDDLDKVARYRGAIQAHRDILQISFEDIKPEETQ